MPFARLSEALDTDRQVVTTRETIQGLYGRLSCEGSDDPSDDLLHEPRVYRSVFLSDIHLGAPGCRAAEVVKFLNHVRTEFTYWNGDIFDLWHLRIFEPASLGKLLKRGNLSRAQLTLVQKMLREDRRGSRQIFIPGNHDEAFRTLIGEGILIGNNVLTLFDAVHETADGKKFLVMHGDSFDAIVHNHRWLGILGTRVFGVLASLSIQIDRFRTNTPLINRLFDSVGLDRHWSLAHQIKAKADGASYDASYEQAMLSFLFRENATLVKRGAEPYSGIICGHTHVVCEKTFASPLDPISGKSIGPNQVSYYNTGHWTGRPAAEGTELYDPVRSNLPSCTALVEHCDGHLEIVRWDSTAGIVSLNSRKN